MECWSWLRERTKMYIFGASSLRFARNDQDKKKLAAFYWQDRVLAMGRSWREIVFSGQTSEPAP